MASKSSVRSIHIPEGNYVTSGTYARMEGVSAEAISRRIKRGTLKAIRVGNNHIICIGK